MTTQIKGRAQRDLAFGIKVDRATAVLPQTTSGTLFTVAGGRVLVTNITGEVTTVIQTQANNTKLVATPTTGTAVDMCAVLDISADEVGCLYTITGLPSDAMYGPNAGLGQVMSRGLVVPIGTIKLSCAASNTGSVKWSITYLPWDDGASVVAA